MGRVHREKFILASTRTGIASSKGLEGLLVPLENQFEKKSTAAVPITSWSSTSEYSEQRPEFLSLDGPGFREGCRGEVEVGTIGKFFDYPWKWGCIDVRRFGFASKKSFDWTKATSRNKEREARSMLAARLFSILTNRSNAMFRSLCAWGLAKNYIWFSRCHTALCISGIFALDESRCTPVKPSK